MPAPEPKSRWVRHDTDPLKRPDWVCKVLGVVEGWVVARYKFAAPFLVHANEWEKRFKPAPPAPKKEARREQHS